MAFEFLPHLASVKRSPPKLVCVFLVLLFSSTALPARPTAHQDPWIQAVALREQLESTPAQQRTPAQFELVLNSFRRIYHDDPTAPKAPAAVASVADLLAEKGRLLGDQQSLRSAIGQYEFLRQQYPNSPQVDNALLLEAEICRQDLKDAPCAEDKLRQVIAATPNSSFAEQANMELRDLEASTAAPTKDAHRRATQKAITTAPRKPVDSRQTTGTELSQPPPSTSALNQQDQPIADRPLIANSQPHPIVLITGMRHWSNPTSTRIAIDLGGQVEYEAARVPNPDRIFFDLHGARLAPNLNGHQVEVIDDGYLKRIRAAQFHPDVTRVVLDVTDVSQYSAFLLPNPWRLIIDIHSDKGASSSAIAKSKLSVVEPQDTSGSSNFPPSKSPALPPPARPSATTRAAADSTIADVAKLSTEPARIPATAGPTSGPVSAKVAPTDASAKLQPSDTTPQPNPNINPIQPPASGSVQSRKRSRSASSTSTAALTPAPALPHPADPTADGQRSLVRALGLKVGRIVIDPGHGGHDSGTLGPGGIQEKDVVLDVALRVGTLLQKRLGAEIVYTRDDDTFIPLETRTAIANKAQADLFLSIHANSSPEPEARGVETYYLNFTSDPNALDVAARENAVSSQSVHQLSDLVRKITLKDKIDESREFAADVDEGLYAGLKSGNPGLKDRGVKKAPFVVLIGAQMPSILAEISFLTNPDDAEKLQTGAYRQRIAEALVAGVERYLRGLSGTPIPARAKSSASNLTRPGREPAGQ